MANQLDEMNGPVVEKGQDARVINQRVPAKTGAGSVVFEVILWICGIIPGVIFLFMKINAKKYFQQLEQKIQHDASTIDNYLVQRGQILTNAARLLDKAIDLDKDVMVSIAQYRGGNAPSSEEARNEVTAQLDQVANKVNVAFESYPDLKAHNEIADVLKQNSYLQREITAARDLYNDTVTEWNQAIFAWPTKAIVASKQGYTTRIPYAASEEERNLGKGVYF